MENNLTMKAETTKRDCILIADDVELSRNILKMLLRREYDVLVAADGLEAISRLKTDAHRISCVLLDIKMPGVDGYGVMDVMRRENILDRIPVIALTSISDPQGHIRCYESGAIDLIEKPFNEEVLLYKIRWNIERFRRLCAGEGGGHCLTAPEKGGGGVSPLGAVEEHCRKMFALETEADVRVMSESFMRTFAHCANLLRQQESNPDFAAVRNVTHDLNSFAANSGAYDLADLSLVLNACAKACNAKATSAAIRRILSLFDAYRG